MQQVDCLLLIQNTIYFSCETIPSKVYEYLLTGRPILGLLHNNQELESMLLERGYYTVAADDVQATAKAIEAVFAAWKTDQQPNKTVSENYTVAKAVDRLLCLTECRCS